MLTKCYFFNINKSTHFGTGGQVSIWGGTNTFGDMRPGLNWKNWRCVAPCKVMGVGHV